MKKLETFFIVENIWMIDAGEYSVKMLATLYGMEYLGMAQNEQDAKRLAERM